MRKDVERNRQHLLNTAQNLLESKGVNFTFNELAKEAHLGVGTVYRHFDSKDALLSHLVKDPINQALEIVSNANIETANVSTLRETIFKLCEFLIAHKAVAQIFLGANSTETLSYQQLILEKLQELLTTVKGNDTVREDFQATDLPFVFSYATYAHTLTSTQTENLWKRYVQALFDGLINEPSTPTPPPLEVESLAQSLLSNTNRIVTFLQN